MRRKSFYAILVLFLAILILNNSPVKLDLKSFKLEHLKQSDDSYEFNNQIIQAIEISEGNYTNLECYDDDYFKIDVISGFKIQVEITFINSTGNLDLELYEASFIRVNESYTFNNYEQASYTSTGSIIYIRVFYVDNPNTYNLSISSMPGSIQKVISVIEPNKTTNWDVDSVYEIKWMASSTIDYIKLELYDKSTLIKTITPSTENNGSFGWLVPNDLSSGDDYRVLVEDQSNSSVFDYSYIFSIYNPSIPKSYISFITPNSSTVWQNGSSYEIKWKASADFDYIDILLYENINFIDYITQDTDNDGSFTWIIPNSIETGFYYFEIRNNESGTPYDYSEWFWIVNTESSQKTILIGKPTFSSIWNAENPYEIKWYTSSAIGNVRIEYILDGITTIIMSSVENTGSYLWTIPSIESSIKYQIRISEVGGIISDTSDYFTVNNSNEPVLFINDPNSDSTLYNGSSYNITWTTLGSIGSVNILLYNQFGFIESIVSSLVNDGYYLWSIPSYLTGAYRYQGYYINITDSSDEAIFDISDDFTIIIDGKPSHSISLIEPGINANWHVDDSYNITWYWTGNFENVTIELYYYYEQTFKFMIAENAPNTGYYSWTVPIALETRDDYYIGIYNSLNCTPFDTSAIFNITNDHSITIITPNASSVWQIGETYEIQWTTTGDINNVAIYYAYFPYDYGEEVLITSSTENNGSYLWSIPGYLTENNYMIAILEVGAPFISGISEEFSLVELITPSITIINPDSTSIWEIDKINEIEWDFTGSFTNVEIYLEYNSSLIPITLSTPNNGGYPWTIPKTVLEYDNYHIIVRDTVDPLINDTSEGFSIIKPDSQQNPLPNSQEIPGYEIFIILIIIMISIISLTLIIQKKKIIL